MPSNYWKAQLSDGTVVYETKDSLGGKSAWEILGQLCATEKVRVVNLTLFFLGQEVTLHPNQPAYFQKKVAYWDNGSTGQKRIIGFVTERGSVLAKQFDTGRGAKVLRSADGAEDPGAPFTIYGE